MSAEQIKYEITEGKTALGFELSPACIKAILIGKDYNRIASGSYDWEDKLVDGLWTYDLDDAWQGLRASFRKLADEVQLLYDVKLTTVGAIGISAMMHGYLVFDKYGKQLVPFRTWRNTQTEQAAEILTKKFKFNIPQRWSIAHLYQAILNSESHVKNIDYVTTLAGYLHWKLTGDKVLGVGEASGMFPIDIGTCRYNTRMLRQFTEMTESCGLTWKLEDILPRVLQAGEQAGKLSEEGANLLDPTGTLMMGIPMCPPEGDAGTGMVATNSVAERTGNISAGTSVFAMVVLENELSKVYPEIDIVTTPTGKPVAMVHCNNCSSDIDAWMKLFREVTEVFGVKPDKPDFYKTMFRKAMEAEADGGGLLSYNYCSGEPITNMEEGRPILLRAPDSRFNLANLMRTLLYSAFGTLKLGMDILTEKENVKLNQILGHGSLFTVKGVGQSLMAAALGVPVAVMETAEECGVWGIALLAAYMRQKIEGETLESYLSKRVFAKHSSIRANPTEKNVQGFREYIKRYVDGLIIERSAVENFK